LSRTTVIAVFILSGVSAAIVLSVLASSAFYRFGRHRAEAAVGKSRSWFHPADMLFSLRRARHLTFESCSMFVRGGVYRVVHEANGRDARQVLRLPPFMFD